MGVLGEELVVNLRKLLPLESTDDMNNKELSNNVFIWYWLSDTAVVYLGVNVDLRVIGIRGLRVGDTSTLPYLLGGQYQAAIYALDKKAADLIIHIAV